MAWRFLASPRSGAGRGRIRLWAGWLAVVAVLFGIAHHLDYWTGASSAHSNHAFLRLGHQPRRTLATTTTTTLRMKPWKQVSSTDASTDAPDGLSFPTFMTETTHPDSQRRSSSALPFTHHSGLYSDPDAAQLPLDPQTTAIFRPWLASFLAHLGTHNKTCQVPHWFVIGAQKGGTSSFHAWLKQGIHPRVHVPFHGKELNLFTDKLSTVLELHRKQSGDKEDGSGGASDSPASAASAAAPFMPANIQTMDELMEWYLHQWKTNCIPSVQQDATEETPRNGEVSPNYLIHPYAPERAHLLAPEAKIIVLLRNPIHRAKSSFNMKWQIARCGSRAWQTAACFRELTQFTAEQLATDFQTEITETFQKELAILQQCFQDRAASSSSTGVDVQEDEDPMEDSYRLLFDCYQMQDMNTVQQWFLLENEFHVGRGVYVDQLLNWFRFYDPSRFLFLSSEEFDVQPRRGMRLFLDFLSVDSHQLRTDEVGSSSSSSGGHGSAGLGYRHHVREYPVEGPLEGLEADLRAFYAPHNQRLYRLLEDTGHAYVVDSLRKHFDA